MPQKIVNDALDIKQIERVSKPAAGLYVVATPIGNLADITLRAIDILKSVDCIICEDTRVTGKLLSYYGIKNKLTVYNDHNASRVRGGVIRRLESGESVALVSDAGTPLISDPGYKLVSELREKNIDVFTVPGPSALTSALSISGLPTDRFLFAGFLPNKAGQRKKILEEFKHLKATLVFYEAATRLPIVLKAMKEVFGESRKMVIARELSKKFEEVKHGTVAELSAQIDKQNVKGEIVLIIEPAQNQEISANDMDIEIIKLIKNNRVKEVVNILHDIHGGQKSKIYDRVIELKNGSEK
jgi:16S rRNA (cytidine1402-2'-O)-methyltransferase